MSSEWMRVMLDEIARKKAQAEQAQIELERRRQEEAAAASHPPPAAAPNPGIPEP